MPAFKDVDLYLDSGFAVLPLYAVAQGACGCGHANCRSQGKHPVAKLAPAGVHSATTARDVAARWWEQGEWNIGLALGAPSRNRVVIDIDDLPTAVKIVRLLAERRREEQEDHTVVRTGSGGIHIYCTVEQLSGNKNLTAEEHGEQIHIGEIRESGTYVVAPPSSHASGKQYEFIMGGLASIPLVSSAWEYVK